MKEKIVPFAVVVGLVLLAGGFLYYKAGEVVSPKLNECETDEDCVPAQCCHPTSCVNKNFAPNCSEIFCTEECKPNTMDCGQGYCACVSGKCQPILR